MSDGQNEFLQREARLQMFRFNVKRCAVEKKELYRNVTKSNFGEIN